jgi:hypothetical protein
METIGYASCKRPNKEADNRSQKKKQPDLFGRNAS